VSTKAAEAYDEDKRWVPCIMCTSKFVEHKHFGPRLIAVPDNVCLWCFCRGDRKGVRRQLYRRFMKMKRALDAIANVQCQKPDNHDDECEAIKARALYCTTRIDVDCKCAERCKCPTCFAGRVYDELFAEYEEEPGGGPDNINSSGASVSSPIVADNDSPAPVASGDQAFFNAWDAMTQS
jgi:hypothetical protein